ncbi:MAG TPA: PASTA domain-containing protein [Clostridia bacterium]|nr:PASTA domain-containing protein [Clostridia bacterium]
MEQVIRRKLDERYEITRQISTCGETVVYLGRDTVSGQLITIKEFFAETIMQRDAAGRAEVLPGCDVQYKSLSSDYEELCNYLMQLPKDFPVLRPSEIIWRNNTVYAIEKYSENETFDDYMARRGHAMSWNQLKSMITPIIKLLGRMHADGVYHRGISPETFLVDSAGVLVVSGFSIPAARTAESEIASTLYFGYSAPEQYSSNSWQGSWSDVYSLAAVCYRALTGITPVEWRQRGKGRALAAPVDLMPEIPQNVSDALVRALTVDLRTRYRTVEEFWCALLVAPGQGTMTYQLPIQKRTDELVVPAIKGNNVRPLLLALALISLVAIFSLALAYRLVDTYFQPIASSSQSAEEGSSQGYSQPSQPEIVVPNLVGTDVQKVLLDPLYQRLFTFEIERIFSESQPAGAIVAQQPKAGEEPGDAKRIYLWVSKGSELIPMPNLQGKMLAEATAELNRAEIGYTVELIEPDEAHQDTEEGTVLNTSIPAGNIVYRNTDTVIIYVAQIPEIQDEEEDAETSWNENYVVSVPPRTETYWPTSKASSSN